MIHLLHAIPDAATGGALRLLESLLESIDRTRFGVSLLLPENCSSHILAAARGARVLLIDEPPKHPLSLAELWRYTHLFKQLRPDIVHTHGWFTLRAAARLAGVPLSVSTKHCAVRIPHHVRLYRAFTDVTVTTSLDVHQKMRACGIPEGELAFIPNAPHAVEALPPTQRLALRRLHGIADNELAVGIAARLVAVKGHRTLLSAAHLLAPLPFRFLLLGEGEERGALEEMIRRLGLTSVTLLGEWRDPSPFYAMLDAHVSCSLDSETSSLSLSEGMSLGIPTVATDIPGNRALVKDGGILVPRADPCALAGALLRIRNDKEHYARLARERALSLPTAQEMTRMYEKLYLSYLFSEGKRKRFPVTL